MLSADDYMAKWQLEITLEFPETLRPGDTETLEFPGPVALP